MLGPLQLFAAPPADQAWVRGEGVLSIRCPAALPARVTRGSRDFLSFLIADLRRCLPRPPQRASRSDQLRLP